MDQNTFEEAGELLESIIFAEVLRDAKTHDQVVMSCFAHMLAGYRAMTTCLATLQVSNRPALLADTRQTLEGILDDIDSKFLEEERSKKGKK